LGLRESVAGFVLPLSSSVFKLSGTLGSPFQLFLLARLFGVELDPVTVTTFILGIMLVSFGTPGIPSGGIMIRAPFFIAAGIPLEGFILTMAADTLTDIFKTTVNVTADMTVACAVNRFDSEATASPAEDSGVGTANLESSKGAVFQGALEE
jgi:Na+/H+-dicarboxylate symporter